MRQRTLVSIGRHLAIDTGALTSFSLGAYLFTWVPSVFTHTPAEKSHLLPIFLYFDELALGSMMNMSPT